MKKRFSVLFGIVTVVMSILAFSCKENIALSGDFENPREIVFEDNSSELKDELIFYSMTESYKLTEAEVSNDLNSFLALKMVNDNSHDNLNFSRAVNIVENQYDIKKVRSFSKTLPSNILLNRSVDTGSEVNFSIFNFSNQEQGTKGIAVTSDDERIGSMLAIIDDIDCTDSECDPVLEIFLSNLDNYVEKVCNELESITEDDLELFKEKYDITDEEIARAKIEYENSIESRKFWGYDSWSNWYVCDINLNNFVAKTKWGQSGPYNAAIKAMEGASYPSGCGTTAVAQIMAYHNFPKSYSRGDLDILKSRWSIASGWDGTYDWSAMTSSPDARYVSSVGQIGVGALMYEISKGVNSSYGINGTSSTMDNRIAYLRSVGYNCDNVSNYSYDGISNSLRRNCPVMVRGDDGTYGHAWVIDGSLELQRSRNYYVFWIPFNFRENQSYVHCNYGWEGSDDNGNAYNYCGQGYYRNAVFETSNGNFSGSLRIVTNISPNN